MYALTALRESRREAFSNRDVSGLIFGGHCLYGKVKSYRGCV